MGISPSSPEKSLTPPKQSPDACPVDHAAREAYLAAASKQNPPSNALPSTASSKAPYPTRPQQAPKNFLGETRVTSTIPRAAISPSSTTPDPNSLPSPSSESHPSDPTPAAATNWIYPSERMFFEAMRRKSYSPNASDMATIVPIHNAVNERAWSEILAWERSTARLKEQNQGCGGPKLRSFLGDSKKLSPRARWKSLVGYERPFDRHDWVVDRCSGPGVEYVIDFYKGRGGGRGDGGKLSFYLDVRPKLNSWEGWRMRLGRWMGFG